MAPQYCHGPISLTIFMFKIQIWWQICIAVIQLLVIKSLRIFAHATTAQLLYLVQTVVVVIIIGRVLIEFPFNLNYNAKIVSEMGPWQPPEEILLPFWIPSGPWVHFTKCFWAYNPNLTKYVLLWLEKSWPDQATILYMVWQLSCHDMCKIVTWLDH